MGLKSSVRTVGGEKKERAEGKSSYIHSLDACGRKLMPAGSRIRGDCKRRVRIGISEHIMSN